MADFLHSLLLVYTLCVLAWIAFSFVFALGLRIPYTKVSGSILDFIRDVSEPYLRLFRRLGLRVGAFDFGPMVAIMLLVFGGQALVRVVGGG